VKKFGQKLQKFGHPNLANRNGGNNKHILIKIFISLLDVANSFYLSNYKKITKLFDPNFDFILNFWPKS